jgi:16S rRNA (uracil1498-N3)-methyltransferase
MHRFYLPPDSCHGSVLTLDGREAHHALRVLRLRKGERVVVIDGVGHEFHCETASLGRQQVQFAVKESRTMAAPECRITLAQALPKAKAIEQIVHKAVELGVWRIVPLLAERSVPHLDSEGGETKAHKWRLIAVEAIKQCGAAWLPSIEPPLPLKKYLARAEKFALCLLSSLQPGAQHPRRVFEAFRARHGRAPESLCLWVGPEGDFTAAEAEAIRAAGAAPITLGPQVLRVETAATCALAIVNYELKAG